MSPATIVVLAGVNGSGKSSVLGQDRTAQGVGFFNPDARARDIADTTGVAFEAASIRAWREGLTALRAAIDTGEGFAFETTLGGHTVTRELIRAAEAGCRLVIWYVGVEGVEVNLARVAYRVAHGGHDIPETKIRQRYTTSPQNLIRLLPHLAELHLWDNTTRPRLILRTQAGRVTHRAGDPPRWATTILSAIDRR